MKNNVEGAISDLERFVNDKPGELPTPSFINPQYMHLPYNFVRYLVEVEKTDPKDILKGFYVVSGDSVAYLNKKLKGTK